MILLEPSIEESEEEEEEEERLFDITGKSVDNKDKGKRKVKVMKKGDLRRD